VLKKIISDGRRRKLKQFSKWFYFTCSHGISVSALCTSSTLKSTSPASRAISAVAELFVFLRSLLFLWRITYWHNADQASTAVVCVTFELWSHCRVCAIKQHCSKWRTTEDADAVSTWYKTFEYSWIRFRDVSLRGPRLRRHEFKTITIDIFCRADRPATMVHLN